MNILIVTFDPPQNVGGIEGRGNNYTKYLLKLGHNVEVISFSPEGDFSKENLNGARLLKFPSSTRRVFKSLRRTTKEISENSIDSIFLLSGALTLYGVFLLTYARWKGIRTLILFYGKDILSSKKSFSASIALRISPRFASKIAVNSHYTASLLPAKYSKKIEVLYPSVDPAIIDEAPNLGHSGARPSRLNDHSRVNAHNEGKNDSSGTDGKTVLFV
ncbi:MAG: glycosyltransferase [Rhabdochlamydiaceae bacterium]